MELSELIKGLNEHNFGAFPQNKNIEKAEDVKRVTITLRGDDEKKYFLTRVPAGADDQGVAIWQWARGSEMKSQS